MTRSKGQVGPLTSQSRRARAQEANEAAEQPRAKRPRRGAGPAAPARQRRRTAPQADTPASLIDILALPPFLDALTERDDLRSLPLVAQVGGREATPPRPSPLLICSVPETPPHPQPHPHPPKKITPLPLAHTRTGLRLTVSRLGLPASDPSAREMWRALARSIPPLPGPPTPG